MIDLRPGELDIVKNILRQFVPKSRVFAFGSRVTGTAKKHSDLDLAIDNGRALTISILGELKEAFSESDLPMRVDVVDLHAVSTEFRQIILSRCEILNRL